MQPTQILNDRASVSGGQYREVIKTDREIDADREAKTKVREEADMGAVLDQAADDLRNKRKTFDEIVVSIAGTYGMTPEESDQFRKELSDRGPFPEGAYSESPSRRGVDPDTVQTPMSVAEQDLANRADAERTAAPDQPLTGENLNPEGGVNPGNQQADTEGNLQGIQE